MGFQTYEKSIKPIRTGCSFVKPNERYILPFSINVEKMRKKTKR
jgi:hypothetical protein